MKNTYLELIEQRYEFPQAAFELRDGFLTFHGVSLQYLIEKYGTPFRLMYLPKIGHQIEQARNWFKQAINNHAYTGDYHFGYCTKCNHFYHVIHEALKHQVDLETSSAYDIDLLLKLYKKQKITKDQVIIHNGYKTETYLRKIVALQEMGFKQTIIVLDNKQELRRLLQIKSTSKFKIGLRMAITEATESTYQTSRLGIPHQAILPFFKEEIRDNDRVELQMLHFFVDSGIKDTPYYWGEFQKALNLYVELKKKSKTLKAFNLGGGFPIRNHLDVAYEYASMINEIIRKIKDACTKAQVPAPDIFTEFGKYTVGEAGAFIFEVLEQKQQNKAEKWYIIDNSLMNTMPDSWSIQEKFMLLPINKWDNPYERIHIGGISCDRSDYYNSEILNRGIVLPSYQEDDPKSLYLGFFHTGAYQDALSGYGGIKHCLIPAPKHIIIDRDEEGNIVDYRYRSEQSADDMLNLLGYNS